MDAGKRRGYGAAVMTGRAYRCRLVTGETLELHAATRAAAWSEAGPHCVAVTLPRRRHTVCKAGAAVRLHGYVPARVLAVYVDASDGRLWAECRITARGPDWSAGRIGPHGYRAGGLAYVRASEAVPRDLIRVSRQRCGALWWPAFSVELPPAPHVGIDGEPVPRVTQAAERAP